MANEQDDVMRGAARPSTENVKFRKGGFRSVAEVEAEADPGEREPGSREEAVAAAAQADAEESVHPEMDLPQEIILPQGQQENLEADSAGEEEPQEQEAEQPQVTKAGKFRIGTRTFETQDEAFAYAQELEAEKIAADAFRQGIEAATGQPQDGNPPAEEEVAEEESPDFIAMALDPKKAREFVDKIVTKVTKVADERVAAQERKENTWREFYSDHDDLIGKEYLVTSVLRDRWDELKEQDTKQALKLVADDVRKKWKDMNPGQALPKTKNPTTAGNSNAGPGVTQQAPEKKPSTFISQFNTLKTPAGRAAARKRLKGG